jgi:hypothetical protein
MGRFNIPQNEEICKFESKACQHISYAGEYLFVNNTDNNINVYKIDQSEISFPETAAARAQ